MYEALFAGSSFNLREESKMKPIDEINMDKLIECCKQVNEVSDDKIEVVGTSTPDLIKAFTLRLESMTDEQQDKVQEAVAFYNDLYADEQVTDPPPPPPDEKKEEKQKSDPVKRNVATTKKKKEKPAAKKKKKEKEPAEKKPPKEKDEFGYTVGTLNNKFMQAIKQKPMTMKEVKDEAWNEKSVTFYEIFKKERVAGRAFKDKDGKMSVR